MVGDSSLNDLLLVNLRFITFLVTSYASFGRYEEVSALKVENVTRDGQGFVLTFEKGKTYRFGENHIGVVSNLPDLDFNPAEILSVYLDRIVFLHSNSDSPSDYLFPSFSVQGSVLSSLDKPVLYDTLLKNFKAAVKDANIDVGLFKVGLHSLRRGGVTHAVRAGAPHEVVQKCMRVRSQEMVVYYATLSTKELSSAAKLAF